MYHMVMCYDANFSLPSIFEYHQHIETAPIVVCEAEKWPWIGFVAVDIHVLVWV